MATAKAGLRSGEAPVAAGHVRAAVASHGDGRCCVLVIAAFCGCEGRSGRPPLCRRCPGTIADRLLVDSGGGGGDRLLAGVSARELPTFANFLISVEAEMDKVSWATWGYLKRATAVVS